MVKKQSHENHKILTRSRRDLNSGHRRSPMKSRKRLLVVVQADMKFNISSTKTSHLLRGRHPWPLDYESLIQKE